MINCFTIFCDNSCLQKKKSFPQADMYLKVCTLSLNVFYKSIRLPPRKGQGFSQISDIYSAFKAACDNYHLESYPHVTSSVMLDQLTFPFPHLLTRSQPILDHRDPRSRKVCRGPMPVTAGLEFKKLQSKHFPSFSLNFLSSQNARKTRSFIFLNRWDC